MIDYFSPDDIRKILHMLDQEPSIGGALSQLHEVHAPQEKTEESVEATENAPEEQVVEDDRSEEERKVSRTDAILCLKQRPALALLFTRLIFMNIVTKQKT